MGTIEGESDLQDIVSTVIRSGASKVSLVAGVHVQEDIAGNENSWKSAFEAAGLTVTVETNGLGKHPAIVDIFGISGRHWRSFQEAEKSKRTGGEPYAQSGHLCPHWGQSRCN